MRRLMSAASPPATQCWLALRPARHRPPAAVQSTSAIPPEAGLDRSERGERRNALPPKSHVPPMPTRGKQLRAAGGPGLGGRWTRGQGWLSLGRLSREPAQALRMMRPAAQTARGLPLRPAASRALRLAQQLAPLSARQSAPPPSSPALLARQRRALPSEAPVASGAPAPPEPPPFPPAAPPP